MKNLKKIIAILLIAIFASCTPEDAPVTTPAICVMHQISQEATIDTNNGGTIQNAVWRQMSGNEANKFYSNVCADENKITYFNSIRFTQNGNPNWLYLRRNIILKQ